ncbi:hypothetical protein C8R46DRAFT_1223998 [Mycena filopes]|nr:hypothetical protein C8R46DRAFT_1223998 [Mycena filopes]
MVEKQRDGKMFSDLACRFCSGEKWSAWKNGDSQTGTIGLHLQTEHFKVWANFVVLKKLKGSETIAAWCTAAASEHQAFSLPGFYERLK